MFLPLFLIYISVVLLVYSLYSLYENKYKQGFNYGRMLGYSEGVKDRETASDYMIILSDEEKHIFSREELNRMVANGIDKISGGYAVITPIEINESDSNIIICSCKVGVSDGEENWESTYEIEYYRDTKTFTEE